MAQRNNEIESNRQNHDIVPVSLGMNEKDNELVHNDHLQTAEEIRRTISKGGQVQMRSSLDDLGIWATVKQNKGIAGVAMAAAFSASLEGYQINLNGGIISNKGFIALMPRDAKGAINGSKIALFGGMQSLGQTLGQIFLQYATDALGRKAALYILWVFLVVSVIIESLVKGWQTWLVAKLFSGIGVGMLQATLPVYIAEISPVNLRGFLINAYTFWFCVGQLLAGVALNELTAKKVNFRDAIYTQWGMIGVMGIIFFLIPESPWWLVSKGKLDQASRMLAKYHGRIEGYNVADEVAIMTATIEAEKKIAERDNQEGPWAVFQGTNLIRLLIAAWPKIIQQFVGLSVFNSYSTYFFQLAGNKNPFLVTVILGCVQLLAMLVTACLSDSIGRRPLTVYPYAVTTGSVLALGVIGCFDYSSKSLGSLLIFFACLATFTTTGASAIANVVNGSIAYASEIPTQRLRARTAGWGLAISNMVAILFSFCTPLMLNGDAHWGVKTGFFFAGTGTIATIIGWFILPEVARRSPAEIDELFEKKVSLRKFKGYKTEVEMVSEENRAIQDGR
ncbi:uncharacterized protein I206_103041 [Kwoniella pini CBS 10737]|uniref:Sugar transporter n=1 Tax=Kwoniella pini CBS 10737 TaxID=1296096 RepID=A0A1B9IB72_9TREE|nr:sugar transporter [Kwoniella pini CBS 10737]OCF52661.1 sugar transporter [Kwoniella pini CBS 10737]